MRGVLITREIGIDMAHRVEAHGSKCKNLHGHRYTIHATVEGPVVTSGQEKGMVMDFGFLKEEMMNAIDQFYDHATCLCIYDILAIHALGPAFESVKKEVMENGDTNCETNIFGKLVLIPTTPTAENLAVVWFNALLRRIQTRTAGRVLLHSIKVWETPNCYVEYRP